jgi:hypothetical protein
VRPSNCDASVVTHISEQEYLKIPYDVVLMNDGTIESYIEKFDKIIAI